MHVQLHAKAKQPTFFHFEIRIVITRKLRGEKVNGEKEREKGQDVEREKKFTKRRGMECCHVLLDAFST